MDRILSRRIRRGGGVRIWLFYRRKCKYSPSQGRFKIPRPHGFVGSTPTGATALRRPGEHEIDALGSVPRESQSAPGISGQRAPPRQRGCVRRSDAGPGLELRGISMPRERGLRQSARRGAREGGGVGRARAGCGLRLRGIPVSRGLRGVGVSARERGGVGRARAGRGLRLRGVGLSAWERGGVGRARAGRGLGLRGISVGRGRRGVGAWQSRGVRRPQSSRQGRHRLRLGACPRGDKPRSRRRRALKRGGAGCRARCIEAHQKISSSSGSSVSSSPRSSAAQLVAWARATSASVASSSPRA